MKRSVLFNVLTPALAACLLVGLIGCATTRQVNEDQQSGFLGDYSMLQKGEKGEANYIYINTECELVQVHQDLDQTRRTVEVRRSRFQDQ